MGYRHYFYLVDKDECEAVKNMTYDEFFARCREKHPKSIEEYDEEVRISIHDAFGQERIFEFGKLYWDDTAKRIYSKGEPLFNDKDMQERFSDYRLYRMGREGMLEAIEIYKEKILSFYEGLLVKECNKYATPFGDNIEPEDIRNLQKVCNHISDVIRWWKHYGVIDKSEDTMKIAGSWMYEHQIFQLVHLLKMIDWDKKCLLFYGW